MITSIPVVNFVFCVFTEFLSRCEYSLTEVAMDGKQKTDRNEKPTERRTSSRLVQSQLNLDSKHVPTVKRPITTDKTLQSQRKSSSDSEPTTPGAGMSDELRRIKDTLAEIKNSMVKKDDIKSIVTAILAEMKGEIKSEIIAEVKESLTKEITEDVKMHVKGDFESQIDQKAKAFASQTKEIADGMNLDLTNIREKFQEQLREMRSLQESMKHYQTLTETALTLANQNQQYSQKNNIKFLGWKEKPQENLREELCSIMRETVNLTIDPTDILAIHRIPGTQGKSRPVIAKFKDADTKIKVIRNRSKEEVKKRFVMFDHLTQMNSQLLRELNNNERIQSAWYFNGKIFGLDDKGVRHKFDIMDINDRKLNKR